MNQTVVGVDPSLTATALCFYTPTQVTQPHISVCKSKPEGKTLTARMRRYEVLAATIRQSVVEANPEAVFIEGYSYGSPAKAVPLGEFGGLLRMELLCNNLRVIEVAPKTLKLFAAGTGNANKTAVVAGLTKRYGVEYRTDDEYDAFGLARLGACVLGWDKPQTAAQTKAVESLKV